jgi:hypothetical protein
MVRGDITPCVLMLGTILTRRNDGGSRAVETAYNKWLKLSGSLGHVAVYVLNRPKLGRLNRCRALQIWQKKVVTLTPRLFCPLCIFWTFIYLPNKKCTDVSVCTGQSDQFLRLVHVRHERGESRNFGTKRNLLLDPHSTTLCRVVWMKLVW